MQADFLEQPLEDWTKYQLLIDGRKHEGWYKNKAFVVPELGVVNENRIDSYKRLHHVTETRTEKRKQ